MAKKMAKKRKQQAGEALSDEQLETVAGGVSLGVAALPTPEPESAKSSSVLMKACATGEHIKEATITVRR